MVMIVEVETNARGIRVGAGHNWTRWPRSVVDRAIAMRTAGMRLKAVSEILGGVPVSTISDWATGKKRQPAARVMVKRVKDDDSFGTNHQQAMTANVDNPHFTDVSAGVDEHANAGNAVTSTVKGDK